MRFRYNTTPEETVSFLREQAINAKQPPAVIDALDALYDVLELPSEVEKLEGQVMDLENDADDLKGALREASEALELAYDILASIEKAENTPSAERAEFYDDADLKGIARQLAATKSALERHKA